MRSKYNCPVCGKVPNMYFIGATNHMHCCQIRTEALSQSVCISRWKRSCKLVKKEYEFDSHGLPIVDLNIPMPKVQRAKGSGHNPPPNKDCPPPPPPPPKNRKSNENIL